MMKKKYIIIIVILFLIFIASIFFSLLNITNDNIIYGIKINNIDISNKNKEEINSMLSDLISKKISEEIRLEYTNENEKNYEKDVNLSVLNIEYNLEDAISDAYNTSRSGNIFQNNIAILKTYLSKKNIILNYSLDEKMLDTIISDISANLPDKLIENNYYIEDENLVITRGTAGFIVDKDIFKNKITELINDLKSVNNTIQIPVKYVEPGEIDIDKIHSEIYKKPQDAYYKNNPFKVYSEVKGVDFDLEKVKKIIAENPNNSEYTISLKYTEPKIKIKDLDLNIFKDKLGTFSTRYDELNKDRTTNLNLAAKKINGTILAPGEEFSYNKIVGERSIAAGYKEAKVYVSGQIVDGLGGGICQISSTLYNAVVFANLKVTQRFNHQFTTSYVPAGRDATVAYGVKDFKFVNSRTYPIKINVSINSGIAKVDIYGIKEEKEYEINFDIEVVSNIPFDTKYETDSGLPSGTEKIKQRGANGIIVNSYRLVKQNGIVISKELISKDVYNALDRVIIKSSN